MLQRWKGSAKPQLKTIWEAVCRLVASKRLTLHVTSDEEAAESAARLPDVPIAVIPNGVRIPHDVSDRRDPARLNILYLGRIDPKKGIENLLLGLKRVRSSIERPVALTIAGGGRADYVGKIRGLIDALGLRECVTMPGMVEGEVKLRLFEQADLAVAPSHTENFGMVVAEALAHGIPVSRWFERAANTGDPIAQNRLARVLAIGAGVAADPVAAAKWHILSKQAGREDDWLDSFVAELTEEQRRQAVAAAQRWPAN
jgi:glycosyltransferase involved in cell wall biosynthesis